MNFNVFNGSSKPCGRSRSGSPRGGFTLIEATVAVVLLLVGMTTTLQAVSWIARERQALDRRALAIRETEHLLDRVVRTEANANAPLSLSSEGERALPDGTITVDREEEEQDGLTMQRITVTLRYQDRPGIPASVVRLRTWTSHRDESSAKPPEEQAP
ncbi:type IV pilus modification PilV family protein [Tautonia marina]|uniref:type IV pilus modification PilV family protein n=1 Tax=Tautonia marina TaxID=2653855 RepID=UPI0012611CE3|nr:prepilin-type N-terminal cleavage/methylation domain-containing protein [Tautonia marina]